jgi:transcriptional regulator with XRE-family HTH domain
MADFQSRFQEALRRRLYPNAALHLKEIGGAIGRSENTVTRWWRGETHVSGEDLYRIALFFTERGDSAFLREVFGELIPEWGRTNESDSAILAIARTLLSSVAESGAIANDSHVWFIASGAIDPAPLGHHEYVRRELRLPASAGDLSAYAMRVLGWITLTERSDGVVVIRHDGRRVAPAAAEAICEWLYNCADRVRSIRRVVHLDGRWIEAHHPDARVAAAAIEKVAFIVGVRRGAWSMKALSLGSITDQRLAALLRAHQEAPEKIVHAAAAMGAFTTSSLFGVKGNDVISHHVATGLGFDPRGIEGLNVLARADTEYALALHARVLRAQIEGPAYYELAGSIDDRYARYLNLVLPEPGPDGRVLTSSVVLEVETMAA